MHLVTPRWLTDLEKKVFQITTKGLTISHLMAGRPVGYL